MTRCSDYLHVKLFGQENILCDTQRQLMDEREMERWERWQKGGAELDLEEQAHGAEEHVLAEQGGV